MSQVLPGLLRAIVISKAATRWHLSQFYVGLNCPRSYALQPGENSAVIMGIETTGDFCVRRAGCTA